MNNETLQIVLTIIGILGAIGLFAGGLGFLFNKFKKGGREERTDVISSADQLVDFWKQQVEGFKEVITELRRNLEEQSKEFNQKLQTMGSELGQIKGQLESEARQKKEYLDILQNRDPATKQFMDHVLQSIKDQAQSHTEIVKVLKDIYTYAKTEHDRDFKVESTITKQ